ncbi:MAG: flagellar basal body-associated FliL family protein [Oceanococcus sp.]
MSAEPAPAAPKKKRKWPMLVFLLLLMSGGGGGAGYYFLVLAPQAAAEAAEALPTPAPTVYFELRPAFVANLVGGRFLQVELDLMARDQTVIDAVVKHNPAIRNDILLLLGNQKPSAIESLDGKLAVQKAATESINAILAKRENGVQVEEVYFSSFVMQ